MPTCGGSKIEVADMNKPRKVSTSVVDFLSDAEEIEHRPLPWLAKTTLYLLAGFIFAFILWATFSHIDRVVVAQGEVVTRSPTMVVQPLSTSVIRSINVKLGQVVKSGEILATFDPTFASADLARLKASLGTLSARIIRLEAELEGGDVLPSFGEGVAQQTQSKLFMEQMNHYQARLNYYQQEKNRIIASIDANNNDKKILTQRLESAKEIEQMRESLMSKGTGSKLHLLESRDQRLAIENALQTAIDKGYELQHELSSADARYDVFVRDWRETKLEELASARKEYDETAEQLAKAKRLNELVELRAPADAVVLEVADRSIGSVMREAEPLITLVPLDAPLQSSIRVSAKDIGFVRIDDDVKLKLDAYPYQKHGWIEGKVRVISEDAFPFSEASDSPANQQKRADAYYRVLVEHGEFNLESVGDINRLLPGMTLTAEIIVGKRRIISYFLYPVIRSLDESFREP